MDNNNTEQLLERYIDFYGDSKNFDISRRDVLIGEQTYKLCELIINADSGVLGAIGLSILISGNIQPIVAVILSANLLFIIFVIFKSFDVRNDILELQRAVIEKKAHTGGEIRNRLVREYSELVKLDPEAFTNTFAAIKNEEKEDMKPSSEEINEEMSSVIKSTQMLRYMFITSLVFTAIAVLLQLFQTAFS